MHTKLSLMIKTGLTLKGIKQTALAEALNVSENTVTHWVQSRRLPDRESLYELKEYFNWSDAKLEMIVEDWHANGHGEKKYRMAGHEYVAERYNRNYFKFLSDIIALDKDTIGGLSDEYEGSPEQWAPIFETCTTTWRILLGYPEQNIAGYWHFISLKDKYFCQLLDGELVDSEITTKMLDFPVVPKHYNAYITMITTRHSDQGPRAFRIMIDSLIKTLVEFAENGVFLSRVGATAFSPKGKKLCGDMGMKFIRRHPRAPQNQVADVYVASGIEMMRGYIGKNRRLVSAYKREFLNSQK